MSVDHESARIWGPCRFCHAPLRHTFVDLGMSPLCESFVSADQLNSREAFYPLHVLVCDQCWLVQLLEYVSPSDIFSEYAYFSSYSDSWLRHAQAYVEMIIGRLGLEKHDSVVEIASNDGYLLQYFVERGFPVLGIEPAANVAAAAVKKGVPTQVSFFGAELARRLATEGRQAKLLLGNNVLAHVPDLNDFVSGLKLLLAPEGTITMEFPHLLRLIEGNQFDTIYHEHFSYFSFLAAERVFKAHGLKIYDVEQLPTHGGSLRIYATHAPRESVSVSSNVLDLRQQELDYGFEKLETYAGFAERVRATKRDLVEFLIGAKRAGKSVAGYGAPGKGNTLLNYCGIRADFVDFTVDRNPYKHGKFLPGTHIPIFSPDRLAETKPDYVLILPWNLRDEIMAQLKSVRSWGGRFVVPIPALAVI
jgi:SAM-dependent methyltransferase